MGDDIPRHDALQVALPTTNPRYAVELVDRLIAHAREVRASDIHLRPTADGLEIRWRIDGVLQPVGRIDPSVAPNVVSRLKVMADLLTYRNDTPQEGRIRGSMGELDLRVSTVPSLHGEAAVIRLFGGGDRAAQGLDQLGLPDDVVAWIRRILSETAGAILIVGPSGAGKTTTLSACLRELAAVSGAKRSLASLEDPIEVELPGVLQSQVNLAAGYTLSAGLRSLLRLDPEVIAVGEIRDADTAQVALQASLTGHLVLTTFHAGRPAEAIGRLLDLGVEPYVLRSGLLAILGQRLVRRLCRSCMQPIVDEDSRLGLRVETAYRAMGCEACHGTGYHGRLPIVELLPLLDDRLRRAVLDRDDARHLDHLSAEFGIRTRWERAAIAVNAGLTSPQEVRRVLGFQESAQDA